MQRHELLALLQEQAYIIPLEKWGLGEAKTLDHLFLEVQSGEARLSELKGKLLRSAKGVVVTVYYTDGNRIWRLEESKQVFRDGRERKRDLDTSIGEKLQPGEMIEEAAYRALREELGITDKLPLIPKPKIIKGPVPSQSYPGLLTEYVMDAYEVFLTEPLYKSEGYVEEQKDKTNYFVWVEVLRKKTPHLVMPR